MVILKAEHLQSGCQGTPVLHDISFEVEEGKIVAILGSNGAGKTTTLPHADRHRPRHRRPYQRSTAKRSPKRRPTKCLRWACPRSEGRHLFNQMSVRDNLLMAPTA